MVSSFLPFELLLQTNISCITFLTSVLNFSVLPTFEVKLLAKNNFFYVDSEDLKINIKAMYVKVFGL